MSINNLPNRLSAKYCIPLDSHYILNGNGDVPQSTPRFTRRIGTCQRL